MQGIESPPEAEIIITDSAKDFFEKFANSQEKSMFLLDESKEFVYLRIRVMAGGCSGFQYSLQLESISDWNPLKEHLLYANKIHILIDSKSYELVKGLVIDYKNDLMESGLTFTNPSSTSTCGCGKSFQ
jgi:iron-sulfur cluster assembly protein